MAETRVQSERYALIGRELIETEPALEPLRRSDARIAFLSSDGKKTSNGCAVMGRCERVPARFRWRVPYDFTVTVFEPNVKTLDEVQQPMIL